MSHEKILECRQDKAAIKVSYDARSWQAGSSVALREFENALRDATARPGEDGTCD